MTNKPIGDLTPAEALQQAIKASQLLLKELTKFGDSETELQEEQQEEENQKIEKLIAVRDQLVAQVFVQAWSEADVAIHQAKFEQLEVLNTQLVEQATNTRHDLHQQRVDNQQGRKAVNAYGTARNQFHR